MPRVITGDAVGKSGFLPTSLKPKDPGSYSDYPDSFWRQEMRKIIIPIRQLVYILKIYNRWAYDFILETNPTN